jgi:hypothetical protein
MVLSLFFKEWRGVLLQNVEILPPDALYAINWRQADWFFDHSFQHQVRIYVLLKKKFCREKLYAVQYNVYRSQDYKLHCKKKVSGYPIPSRDVSQGEFG